MEPLNIFHLLGALGLLLIIAGLLQKQKKRQYLLYIFGGICLTGYSIYIQDLIFILLQAIFVVVALWKFRTR